MLRPMVSAFKTFTYLYECFWVLHYTVMPRDGADLGSCSCVILASRCEVIGCKLQALVIFFFFWVNLSLFLLRVFEKRLIPG